jgi:hypothetical protein
MATNIKMISWSIWGSESLQKLAVARFSQGDPGPAADAREVCKITHRLFAKIAGACLQNTFAK